MIGWQIKKDGDEYKIIGMGIGIVYNYNTLEEMEKDGTTFYTETEALYALHNIKASKGDREAALKMAQKLARAEAYTTYGIWGKVYHIRRESLKGDDNILETGLWGIISENGEYKARCFQDTESIKHDSTVVPCLYSTEIDAWRFLKEHMSTITKATKQLIVGKIESLLWDMDDIVDTYIVNTVGDLTYLESHKDVLKFLMGSKMSFSKFRGMSGRDGNKTAALIKAYWFTESPQITNKVADNLIKLTGINPKEFPVDSAYILLAQHLHETQPKVREDAVALKEPEDFIPVEKLYEEEKKPSHGDNDVISYEGQRIRIRDITSYRMDHINENTYAVLIYADGKEFKFSDSEAVRKLHKRLDEIFNVEIIDTDTNSPLETS